MGPALEVPGVLEKVMLAGANAFRINFSHGNDEQRAHYLALIRAAAHKLKRPCSVLADLMGPKVRVDSKEYMLEEDAEVFVVPKPGDPLTGTIGISYSGLAALVKPGQKILLDDGKLEIIVEGVKGKKVRCRVVRGGLLTPNKSLNVPGVDLGLPVLSTKDKEDLRFIKKVGFDWIAASFVRNGADIHSIKKFMHSIDLDLPIIAKVESAQAVQNLREIVTEAEGVMVARGDLGVELDLELIPTVQRNTIHLARELGKVTIIATQMLETMTMSSRPTRAEVTDVSTAALARVDALMLSGETATGKYPVEAVQMMDRTIRNTEKNLEEEIVGISHPETIALICEAGQYLSGISGASAVVTISTHGTTPRILASFRGNTPVVVACTTADIYNRSTLYYGVTGIMVKPVSNPELVFKHVAADLKQMGLVKQGDVLIFVFGHPIHARKGTNSIRRWEVD
jgi:pyruvate kinase